MNPIFKAVIQKGKVVFDRVGLFNDYLTLLEGKEVDIVVRKHKKNRSNNQNAYYFGVVIKILSEDLGYSDDEMHSALKMMFLQDNLRKIPTLRSTASLSTTEFEEYLEKIRQWAAQELSCVIPLPNEVDFGDTEAPISPPVSAETLKELFGWAGKGYLTEEKIVQLSIKHFGKEPRELTEKECSELDTIVLTNLNKNDIL
jgi:hypothetical protein